MKKIKFQIKYIYFFAIFFVLAFLFFQASSVSAAELFFRIGNQTKIQNFSQGDEFKVDVLLNTTIDSINAIQAGISFPDKLLELKEIRDGNSIVNFWVAQPKSTQAGMVSFSGIITGGYKGANGFLFSLIFLAKSTGSGAFNFDNTTKAFLNDGYGTQASLKTFPLQISISSKQASVQQTIEPVADTAPPEDFTPEIVQNPTMFGGKYFLVFVAQDNGSGIDHYEIYETKTKIENATNVKWNVTDSPYVLQDQKLQSFIYVKAVDKSGNERIEVVQPSYVIKWYETWWLWCIIVIIGIIILYVTKKFLWKRKS